MVLLPTARGVGDFKRRLLASERLEVLWRPEILTFSSFADRVLRATRPGLRCISGTVQEIILSEVVSDLKARGELPLLAPLDACAGLIPALREWIAEFKRAEVTPEAFAEYAGTSASAKDRQLAQVYLDYQRRLHKLSIYDPEGQFWHAKEVLQQALPESLQGLDTILLDGFYDFTPMELSVLQLLGDYGSELVMTLVHAPDESRPELFETPSRTLQRLGEMFSLIPTRLQPVEDRSVRLRHLERALFSRTPRPAPEPESSAITFLETPGDLIELEEVARTIKTELLPAGMRPEEICVVVRTSRQYASIAADVFTRFGIPYHLDDESSLAESPVGRLALQLLAVVNEDFSLSAFASFLRSSLLDLSGVSPDAPRLAHELQDICIEAGIVGSRGRYLPRLHALARRLRDRLERTVDAEDSDRYLRASEIEARLKVVDRLCVFLDEVFKRLEPLLSARSFETAADALAGVLEEFGLRRVLCRRDGIVQDQMNLRACELLRNTLDALVRTAELVGWDRCTLNEFARQASRMMNEAFLGSALPHSVGVTLMGVHEVRALSFRAVFVCGLLDRVFPRAHREGPFHDDAERSAMEQAGLNLRPRRAEQSEEAFLFYLACTRATEQLFLTHPVTDREGKERLVSYYVDEVVNTLGPKGAAGHVRRVRLNELVPIVDRLASMDELRRRCIFDLCAHGAADLSTLDPMLGYLHLNAATTFELVRDGLAAEAERESFQPFGPFDGVLLNPLIEKGLRSSYGPEYPFSPSALEDYAQCPFRFYCRHVLGLVEPATLEEDLSPAEVGVIYHDVLWEFFHTLRTRSARETVLTESHRSEYLELMTRLAEVRIGRLCAGREDVHPVLWRLAQERIEQTLSAFVKTQIDLLSGPPERRPAYLEISFGLRRRRGVSDERSTGDRLVLRSEGEEPISVAGKIDRIDVIEDEPGGFVIVDYKSGHALPTKSDLARGSFLQLPLYVLAAEEVLFAGRALRAAAAELYRLYDQKTVCFLKRASGDKDDVQWTESLDAAAGFVFQYVGGIRRGEFPVVLAEGASCPAHCEFRQICRYSERRVLKKTAGWKPWFHHDRKVEAE